MLSPFLKKIRIALCLLEQEIQRHRLNICSVVLDGLGYRQTGSLIFEGAYFREIEQAFRIRLCFTHPSTQLRKTSTHQHHRKLTLRGTVQRSDQRSQLRFFHILQLVDEQDQGGSGLLRCDSYHLEQFLKIVL